MLFYVCKYWYSLKMALDCCRNMWDCFYIQQLVQFVGDVLVYNIRVVCMDTRLTVSGVLKDLLMKGDSELTETKLLYFILSIASHFVL
jgi:hypothetical protein